MNSNVFEGMVDVVDKYNERAIHYDPFFFFEPWDCVTPSQEILNRAAEDGVNLLSGELIDLAGPYPRLFQTGMILSKAAIAIAQGGSQIGKTISPLIEAGIMVSHQLPFSLRYERGFNTKIKRQICTRNILRFGRFDAKTGEFLDHAVEAVPDPESWDCGCIIGAGIYPKEKFAPPGSQIWIGTLAESVKTTWWPKIAGEGKQRIFPPQFIDTSKGNDGVNKQMLVVNTVNDCRILIKTYEQGHTKFESEKCWTLIYDEEPTNKSIFVSGSEHAVYQRMSFTPLNGITWSRNMIFGGDTKFEFYHASQYDSPYQDKEVIDIRRKTYSSWERQSRIWGLHSEQTGEPFYDRRKVNLWLNRYIHPCKLVEFAPTAQYYKMVSLPSITDIPGLLDIDVKINPRREYDERSVWKMFEDRKVGEPYVLTADCAEGAIVAEEAADKNSAIISRPSEDNGRPIIVASIKSSLPTLPFARSCSYAMRYYNNALLASERGTGKDNEAFGQELDDWPFWFFYTAMNDKTNRATQKKGFSTTASSRDIIFELIRDWIDEAPDSEDPMLRDELLMRELAGAVIGKSKGGTKTRCDHTRNGSLDMTIAFGICLYIYDKCKDQIKCNCHDDYNKRESRIIKRVQDLTAPKPSFMGGGVGSSRR